MGGDGSTDLSIEQKADAILHVTFEMPGLNTARAANNGKGMSRSAVRKIGANRRMVESALTGDLEATHTFARITKVRGFCQMTIKLADGDETLATIRGVLKGGGPTRMKLGDVVLVEPLTWDDGKGAGAGTKGGGGPSHLIVGVLDSKQIAVLRKAGTIPEWMTRKEAEMTAAAAAASASGYTFGEDEEGEEEGDAAGGKAKRTVRFGAGAGAGEDEEIDIDAI
jgi:translation initiation factor IF-1